MNEMHINRHAYGMVAEALGDTRVVLVTGPRQSGKTTLVRQFATSERAYVTLDDQATLKAAQDDPTGFIRALGSAVIDEIQHAPELLLAIKIIVDMDNSPGRFLLTGSANVMALPRVGDSLAGRIALIELMPLSQSEIQGTGGKILDQLFEGHRPTTGLTPVVGVDLRKIILDGGYPEALKRTTARRKVAWFKDYLRLLIDRDARDVANIEQLGQLPSLLAHLAEQAGSSVNISNLATSLKLSRQTVVRYVEALERMFLVRSLQPWHSNKISRITKTPKLQFFDSGLLASQLGVADLDPLRPIPSSGALFETFVHGELRKMMGWSETRMSMYHFRTREGDEVDFVIEGPRGQIVGIEVKSSATLKRADFSGLRKLEEAAGDKFVYGLLLHDHDRITPYSERILGAPLSWLWQV
jgi:predicted AAA+ superfamily ATPase